MSNGFLVHPKLPKGQTVINGHVFVDGVLEIPVVRNLDRFVSMYTSHFGLIYAGEDGLESLMAKLRPQTAPAQPAPEHDATASAAPASSSKKAEK